jgi:hypothetical protein
LQQQQQYFSRDAVCASNLFYLHLFQILFNFGGTKTNDLLQIDLRRKDNKFVAEGDVWLKILEYI